MIILDTNVISEIIKKQPDEHVANWLRNQDTSNLATTAITVAELLAGAAESAHRVFFGWSMLP